MSKSMMAGFGEGDGGVHFVYRGGIKIKITIKIMILKKILINRVKDK